MTATGSKITANKAEWGGSFFNRKTLEILSSTLSSNTATCGAGFYNAGTAYVNSSTITGNKALYGGGVYNDGNLYVGGTSAITSNQATSGYGGGIYSAGSSVILDGTKVLVKSNKAHQPSSVVNWYQGYGVYLSKGAILTINGFDEATQVTGNSKI
jgi:hypothetical protein